MKYIYKDGKKFTNFRFDRINGQEIWRCNELLSSGEVSEDEYVMPFDDWYNAVHREFYTWQEEIKNIHQCPQRQDALNNQLRDLIPVANKLGFYDAADYLGKVVNDC